MGTRKFKNREQAGLQLAQQLRHLAAQAPLVIALPRGGVPVGFEVAKALQAPLDVWVVRKIGVPWQPEFGVGAVAEGGFVYVSKALVAHVGLSAGELAEVTASKHREVDERVRKFRGDRPRPVLRGRTVILVDDGIATGGTVRAAIASIRAQEPAQLVLAVPVAAPDTLNELTAEVDQVVCLLTPVDLHAVGLWYEDFTQVSDDEVVRLLDRARSQP